MNDMIDLLDLLGKSSSGPLKSRTDNSGPNGF